MLLKTIYWKTFVVTHAQKYEDCTDLNQNEVESQMK
jgi:hypothetical protein